MANNLTSRLIGTSSIHEGNLYRWGPSHGNHCVAQLCYWCLKVGSELRRPDAPTGHYQVSTYVQEIPTSSLSDSSVCEHRSPTHPLFKSFVFEGQLITSEWLKRGAKTSRFSRWMNRRPHRGPGLPRFHQPAGCCLAPALQIFHLWFVAAMEDQRRRKDNFTDTEMGK